MAPPKIKTGDVTVNDALDLIDGGNLRERSSGLDDLIYLLDKKGKSASLSTLRDKHYHRILEILFKCAISEKKTYAGGKRTTAAGAGGRLGKCAEALRLAVGHGASASKLKRKTMLALIDHVTQALPCPPGSGDGPYVEPLLKDYVRSILALLSHQANVEQLATLDATGWKSCVDFCVDAVRVYLDHADRDSGSRGSPAPGTASLGFSTGRSTNASQRVTGQIHRGTVQDLVHCIHLLVCPPNAPLHERSIDLSETIIQVLQLRHLGLSQVIQLSFASITKVFLEIQANDISRSASLARDLVPLISHWWQARTASQDGMLNSIRDEMLKTMLIIHLHLERLVCLEGDDTARKEIIALADSLWLEYSRRTKHSQLQLDDLTFAPQRLPEDYFTLELFGLRIHNREGERGWVLCQNLAILERIIWKSRNKDISQSPEEQPRKKRKTHAAATRLQEKLQSPNSVARILALQLVPFLLQLNTFSVAEVSDLVIDLAGLAGDKDSTVVSWAMLACSSSAISQVKSADNSDSWRQLWQVASRAVGLPNTSRAASVLLHTVLDRNLVLYHDVSDAINSIVTTADTNGPALLVDSSITLMFHLRSLRNVKLPNASQSTNHHVIRWIFQRWNPADWSYARDCSIHAPIDELANLIRACCGARVLTPTPLTVTGGSICEVWKTQYHTAVLTRYLLLLDAPPASKPRTLLGCRSSTSESVQANDASFHASKRLVLELLFPKVEELQDLCDSWARKGSEGGAPMSSDRLHSLFSANITGILLASQLVDLNSGQSRDIESLLAKLSEASISAASNSSDNTSFELLLRTIRPVLPSLNTAGINSLEEDAPLLRLISTLTATVEERSLRQSSGQDQDLMDVDDDFDSQESSVSVTLSEVSRSNISISLNGEAFIHETIQRLYHCASIHKDNGKAFMEQLLSLPDKEFMLCSTFTSELFESDLPISEEDAIGVVERTGDIMGEPEYSCCEVAHSTSLRILQSLMPVYKDDQQPVAKMFGDLYHHFVSKYLPNNLLSPLSQMSLSSLLLALLRTNPQYGSNLGLDSCRTTLLSIMQSGTLPVKFFIGSALPDVFGSYVLKMHDDIFLDVLNSLPTNSQDLEGIAFRLFVLSQLACRWPTLLRRCTYHIFETPGNIMQSSQYAKRCLETVSEALCLSSSQELFRIFSPQLLYTWLASPENDENGPAINKIEDIPYEIFGFPTLDGLLQEAQTETTALQIMRRRYKDVESLSQRLGTSLVDMVTQGFTKIMAYTIAHELSTPTSKGEKVETGETWVRTLLGNEPFLDQIYLNFADIVALLLDLFDQEDPIEKHLSRDKSFEYACEALDEMKHFSQSTTALPPNQQPMFRAKYLTRELFHVCRLTEYELQELWTPALVVSVARRIFNTVHPALGSFHACSVLRKVRVLIALAGPGALEAYPLEMLLSSVRPFIVDSECADDALGVSRYLITKGAYHLEQTPTFLAGYALSTLASLRVFLESTQSSTTQESQFKATMSKAQTFHSWFSSYLTGYDSNNFADEQQREAFRLITQSASKIRSSGNAEKGTHESTLLMEILRDGERESKLLNEAARDLALGLLCGDFAVPTTGRQDVISDDDEALRHTGLVWKSCNALALSDEYLAWAGRVMGRSFAASGEIQAELLEESELSKYSRIAPGANDSEKGLLSLLQQLTQSKESAIGGLAESALRAVVSEAAAQEDGALVSAAQQTLTESLYLASAWAQYRTPPSDFVLSPIVPDSQVFFRHHVESSDWVQQLAVYLSQSVSEYIVLSALVPILKNVKGFAQDAFPFIVHLALYSQLDKQPHIKRNLSEAAKEWLKIEDDAARTNQKQLINTILYLRTQSIPQETSIADRVLWLDVDFAAAAAAASRCGMYKTALLFTEVAASQTVRSSRRSSAIRENDSTEVLLSIFENIDDPDAYYGLPQSADLSSVLARLDYEKDGSKTLLFRGAQYDEHILTRDPASQVDSQCLVRALGTLGLAGLSHSLLQTKQSHDGDEASLEDTFQTARRLELWNLPVPSTAENCAVTIYKAYQNVQQATDTLSVRNAICAGFSQTMRSLVNRGLNAASLRQHLGALAVLTELDDIANVADFSELESMLGKFERHGQWMRRGRYEDVSHLLSCRRTSLSLIRQKPKLRAQALTTVEARQIEIRCMLMSSGIYRFHQATQECLKLATSLVGLIGTCDELGVKVDAAINIETANSLWDHGEMIPSIRILQSIDSDSSLKKQTIPVSRSDLLSKIGYQVSVAKLENPHDIQKNYLEPALKDLKGNSQGQQAGHVYHQFAMFCDEQLQDQDSLKDLARLQTLREGKSDEVSQLQDLISSTRDPHLKQRYQGHLNRARLWLGLDEQKLRRMEQTRGEFVRLSLENYLLSLTASDEHNNDALRFTALWLERSEEPETNEAVKKHLDKTPTRKFATLMNQLSSRLQDQPSSPFQKLLIQLVYKICLQHPYHGMYQIWSGTKVKTRKEDQVAVLRLKATEKVASLLQSAKPVAAIWQAIDRTSSYYHRLAVDRDSNKFKAGQKMALKDVHSAQSLQNALAKYKIPPPTMQLEVSATMDYSNVPIISKLDPQMSIASGVSAPKIITAVGSDGKKYRQLVKGGNDDLRQDAIMEQVFAAVSDLLKLHRSAQQRNLGIRTYKVLPLTSASGLIEFVPNTIPLHDFLMPAHERYFPKDLKGSQCRKDISNAQGKTVEHRITAYRKVIDKFHPVMKYFFMENFVDPDEWFAKRLAYTRTTAAISMLGHVLGLGDRHGHNILLDSKTGEVVHIDLGVAFEMGRILPVPELVPFRLTRDIVDGMGITGTEGVFRRCCEFTLHALREETYSIMTILDVLRYDPLYSWSISPVRLAKLQREVQGDDYNRDDDEGDEDGGGKGKKGQQVNEPSEANRALEVVRGKLSTTLSVTATVNDLINQATDISNLAVLYSGWAAYA
ncbi:Serine/threonine-protein kinase tel1 [Colletotrichum scovillei]|uniref:Serine/threonine-protein kinase Tel1 n=1 Tax=Colletotrichum scovillei TaxID=1209932 RepID=A0A9P7UDA4_9PEZI|nr:Serine/threonine-protein kinase tel1 [Colletotrichum scovillei]KAG7070849.1 Serine/threonine-protein kinase tel1 [Colletotrichum scovillei]KAG7079114.1 Serine/threonine-protein kinase tel1 [Colletotrichum scovillei]